MDIDKLLAWVPSVVITAVLVPLAVYFTRYWWDRRRWHTFDGLVREWASTQLGDVDGLTEGDWKSLVAIKLHEAGFEPGKINELLQLAVAFAQGQASQELHGKLRTSDGDAQDDLPNGPR